MSSKRWAMSEQIAVTEALLAAQKEGRAAALVTVIETQGSIPRHEGSRMLVYADGAIVGTIGGGQMESRVIKDAQDAIDVGETRIVEYSLSDMASGDPRHLRWYGAPVHRTQCADAHVASYWRWAYGQSPVRVR